MAQRVKHLRTWTKSKSIILRAFYAPIIMSPKSSKCVVQLVARVLFRKAESVVQHVQKHPTYDSCLIQHFCIMLSFVERGLTPHQSSLKARDKWGQNTEFSFKNRSHLKRRSTDHSISQYSTARCSTV